jgi:D-alanine transaminase
MQVAIYFDSSHPIRGDAAMLVYFNGDFIPKEDVRISPDDRGFLLADGVYEVLRAYGGKMFRAGSHARRLARSLRELRMSGPDEEDFIRIASELLRCNHLDRGDAKIYVQVTRGTAPRRHSFPDEATSPTVYAEASPFRSAREKWDLGVKIIVVPDIRWARCDIKSVALLPNVLASQRAKESGAEEAVFVREGAVTEGAHTSFCAVFDRELVTHPLSNLILAGVTRRAVLELCQGLGVPFKESPIPESELRQASELMILGTTTEIMPVVQVDDWCVGDGRPGPVTRRLQQAFRELVAA